MDKTLSATAKFYVEVMNTKRQKEGKFGHAVYTFVYRLS